VRDTDYYIEHKLKADAEVFDKLRRQSKHLTFALQQLLGDFSTFP
jgi:hypothetical protein